MKKIREIKRENKQLRKELIKKINKKYIEEKAMYQMEKKQAKMNYKLAKRKIKIEQKSSMKQLKMKKGFQIENVKQEVRCKRINKGQDKKDVLSDDSSEHHKKKLDNEKKQENKKMRKEELILLTQPPHLRVIEEIGNSVTHGVGAFIAIGCLVLMLLKSDTPREYIASSIYGVSFFLVMAISCLYHAFAWGTTVKRIFRRFDYSMIYLLIGGTFAPLFLVYWQSTFGLVMFIIQWVCIITGITMVAVFGPGRLKWLHFPLYFVLGWSGLMFFRDWIVTNNIPLLLWVLIGGATYTIGMIPFSMKAKNAHFIFHFFCLFGAIIQWIGIYLYVF